MATYSSILAWKIPRTEGAWQATADRGCKESDMCEHQRENGREVNHFLKFPTELHLVSYLKNSYLPDQLLVLNHLLLVFLFSLSNPQNKKSFFIVNYESLS